MPSQIVVVNESTLLDDMAWRCAWTLNWQLRHHVAPLWNISIGATFMPRGVPIPAGTAVLHLLDKPPATEEPGVLGFHDEDGNELPYSDVYIKTAQEDGMQASEVISHEGVELALNPHVDLMALSPDQTKLFPFEMCDPCEGNGYGIGSPGNQLLAADFVKPNWFDPKTPATATTDYLGTLLGPGAVLPTGYVSFLALDELEKGWQQAFGAKRDKLPPWASRLPRLHVGFDGVGHAA